MPAYMHSQLQLMSHNNTCHTKWAKWAFDHFERQLVCSGKRCASPTSELTPSPVMCISCNWSTHYALRSGTVYLYERCAPVPTLTLRLAAAVPSARLLNDCHEKLSAAPLGSSDRIGNSSQALMPRSMVSHSSVR